MSQQPAMTALVVYESFFGNTASIAHALAEGLRLENFDTDVIDVADVESLGDRHHDLLVVGAPTHAFALSHPSTREAAVARGGSARYAVAGLRERLAELPRATEHPLAATFDTRVSKVRHLPASAARSAAHLLRHRGFQLVDHPVGFCVQDTEGPLEALQMNRAVTWGRDVGRAAATELASRRGLHVHGESRREA